MPPNCSGFQNRTPPLTEIAKPSDFCCGFCYLPCLRLRGRVVASVEGMYVVEFGDVALPVQQYRNGGVVVLETNRIFGGDSGYYYVGTFATKDGRIDATARIVKHDPNWTNAFGDASQSFNIKMSGTVTNGVIQGSMERLDGPGIRLPIRMTWKESLP
jgi:hypothetical protein